MAAPAGSPPAGTSPIDAQKGEDDPFAERPELFVGGAFVGGLALAMLLKKLGS